MRLKPFEKPTSPRSRTGGITERPPVAYDLLAPEQEVDDGIEFDPHRDIRQEKLKEMYRALEESRRKGQWWGFGFMAMRLAIIFPERRDELGLDDEVWKGIKGTMDEQRRNRLWKDWKSFSILATFLAVLFPERKAELELDEEAWEGMRKEFDGNRGGLWSVFSDMAVRLAILFPERRDKLNLEEAWPALKKGLGVHRRPVSIRPGLFSHMAMNLALLFPERLGELNLDEDWEKMKKDMEISRRDEDSGEGLARYTDMAMHLTVLAAQEAYIDHSGRLRITPKKPQLSKTPPPLPNRFIATTKDGKTT